MKTRLRLALFFPAFLISLSFAYAVQIDSVVVKHCKKTDMGGYSTFKTEVDSFDTNDLLINAYTYDTSGNLLSFIESTYSNSGKLLLQKSSRIVSGQTLLYLELSQVYDTNDSLISSTTLSYSNGNPPADTAGNRTLHFYNLALNQDTAYTQLYDRTQFVWNNNIKTFSAYDSNNRLAKLEMYYFDAFQNEQPSYKDSYFYLPNDSIDFILRKCYTCIPDLDSQIFIYSYDGSNQISEIMNRGWDGTAAGFTFPYKKIIYNYNLYGNLTSITQYDSTSAGWTAGQYWNYTYDSHNRLTYELEHISIYAGSSDKTVFEDITNQIDSTIHCEWTFTSGFCDACDYEFHKLHIGINELNHGLDFSIFPNPAHNHFQIQLPGLQKEAIIVRVADIASQLISEKIIAPGNEIISFPDLRLSKGIYLVTLESKSQKSVKKLIIQ